MTAETSVKQQAEAVEYFERKLQFEFGPIGLKLARERGDKLHIIDLREPDFYAKGHVPSAVNIQYDSLEAYLPNLDRQVMTVLYGYDYVCYLPTKAGLLLAKHGYRVKELAGGFDGWAEKDYPVQTD